MATMAREPLIVSGRRTKNAVKLVKTDSINGEIAKTGLPGGNKLSKKACRTLSCIYT
jgi:hypothetical protein